MLSFILIVLAAICNAISDNVSHHYYKSIFKKLNRPKFWNNLVSCDTAPRFWGWKFDAFHVFKSLMILLLLGAASIPKNFFHYGIIDYAVMGILWNRTFVLFYEHLLNEKTK